MRRERRGRAALPLYGGSQPILIVAPALAAVAKGAAALALAAASASAAPSAALAGNPEASILAAILSRAPDATLVKELLEHEQLGRACKRCQSAARHRGSHATLIEWMRRREGEQWVVTYTPQILEGGEDVCMGGALSAALSAAVSAALRVRTRLLRRPPVYQADRSVQEGLHWV